MEQGFTFQALTWVIDQQVIGLSRLVSENLLGQFLSIFSSPIVTYEHKWCNKLKAQIEILFFILYYIGCIQEKDLIRSY